MSSDPAPVEPGVPARHSLGRVTPIDPDNTHDGTAGAWFAVVLRGYDRSQVDARLAELDRRIRDEILRADTAEAGLAAARVQMRRNRDGAPTPDRQDDRDERGDFGLRVERVLQAAEREAAELREKAVAEAASLVENARAEASTVLDGARAEAEQQRQRTEEALLGRAAKLDHEFSTRSAALDARQREVDGLVEDARRDAEAIRFDAERAAATERSEIERRASELRREAEEDIERDRAGAARELDRLTGVREEVRGELARLHDVLRGELHREPDTAHADVVALFDERPDEDPLTGTLRLAPEPRDAVDEESEPDRGDANARTAVGTIPPYTLASIGVLPFGDRSAGGPANGRSFAFELGPTRTDGTGWDDHAPDGPRTSDDAVEQAPSPGRTPTRSTTPSRGGR